MASIKIANEYAKKGKIDEAIKEYELVATQFPNLRKFCDFNINLIRKKSDFVISTLSKYANSNQVNLAPKSPIDPDSSRSLKVSSEKGTQDSSIIKETLHVVYSNENSTWADWKQEFGPGVLKIENEGKSFSISSQDNRCYLSRNFKFKAGKQYTIKIIVSDYSGEIGNFFALVNCKSIRGDLEKSYKSISSDGQAVIRLIPEADTSGSIRIGVGTTTAVKGQANIVIRRFEISEKDVAPNNSDVLSKFAKNYIDPELLLPALVGVANDYSYIEDKQKK